MIIAYSILGRTALLLTLGATAIEAQAPDAIYRRMIAALEPDSGQRIELVRDSIPDLFPGAIFLRGRRLAPPFPAPEDARPRVVSIIITRAETLTVTSLGQLDSIWPKIAPRRVRSVTEARRAVIGLLGITDVVSPEELITSRADARRKAPRRGLVDPMAADQIMAPRATWRHDGFDVVFFASMPLGLYRYRVHVSNNGSWLARPQLLSPSKIIHM